MSQFKRAFLSAYLPFPLHKQNHPPRDHSTNSVSNSVSSSSGLHLCRGTSVVCDHIDILKENQHATGKTSKTKEQNPQPSWPLQSISEAVVPALPSKSSPNSVEFKGFGEKIALLPPPSPNHPLHVCDHVDILKENQHPDGKASKTKEQNSQPRRPLQSISEAAVPASPSKISPNSVECKDYGEKIALLSPPSPNHPLHVWDHVDILKENQHPDGKSSKTKEQNPHPCRPLQSISEAAVPASPPKILPNSVECKDFGEKIALFLPPPSPNRPLHVWDDPGYDVAPASSWSTLANRTLLCRPLPLDVGRCACYVVREHEGGVDSPTVYSLYTDEGQGREDRRLAIARHRRRGGRSEFIVAQRSTGNLAKYEDEFLGRVRSNLVGSRYFVWEQANSLSSQSHQCRRQLLGIITFEPTVTTLTGAYRVMKACIPKYQSIQMNNSCIQPEKNGMTKDKEENIGKVHQLCSRKPTYNRETKRYELDFRDRSRRGCKIKTSVKNFQLIMKETGKQVIMQFGKIGKSKYMMEYRFPLTGYQAFSICLASIDSKLCCSI